MPLVHCFVGVRCWLVRSLHAVNFDVTKGFPADEGERKLMLFAHTPYNSKLYALRESLENATAGR